MGIFVSEILLLCGYWYGSTMVIRASLCSYRLGRRETRLEDTPEEVSYYVAKFSEITAPNGLIDGIFDVRMPGRLRALY